MCFKTPMPPFSPEHFTYSDGNPSNVVVFQSALELMGYRFPQKPRLIYNATIPLTTTHSWITEGVEVWLPQLCDVDVVYFDSITKPVMASELMLPPVPPNKEDYYRHALRGYLRAGYVYSLPPARQLASIVRGVLSVYPRNEAYLWLISHQLIPFATIPLTTLYHQHARLVCVDDPDPNTPRIITEYIENGGSY